MIERIIIAGFGGQGVILAGKLLAYTGMVEGKHVSHIPSYGVEMRGGTANCAVIVSDKEVASPLVPYPTSLVVMNKPSLDKFEEKLNWAQYMGDRFYPWVSNNRGLAEREHRTCRRFRTAGDSRPQRGTGAAAFRP